MKKRGVDDVQGVVTFLVILALLIVLYVLLLPPAERESLLNQTDNEGTPGVNGNGVKTLLLESPGTVYPIENGVLKHDINPVNVYVKIEPEITTLANSLYISRGLFGGQNQNLVFNVNDLSNLNRLVLSFSVTEPRGTLIIEINGNVIFNEKLVVAGSRVIELPISFVNNRNELKFYTNNPGILFWMKNQYSLSEIKLKEEFKKVNSKETRTFTVTKSEKNNVERSTLRYFLYCNSAKDEDTILKIMLNENTIGTENVKCQSGERNTDFNPGLLNEGNNELGFTIDSGDYLINEIKIYNQLKTKMFATYFFSIDSDDYDKIKGDEKNVVLRVSLGPGNEVKKGTIFINQFTIHINTDENFYEKDISDLVLESENLIKIVPENEFDVNSLRIDLI
ncbi:MAG TPA: hypothetical protein VJJ23_03600 [Candidatus Nanoarchaeia archaeon]|nr:hypothetical protein [Candidatus Nanoarchaeia archaeon]